MILQELRSLENRLDKARLKCKEAEHIRKTYEQIKGKLEEEHKTFERTLDEMEQEIMRSVNKMKIHLIHIQLGACFCSKLSPYELLVPVRKLRN